MKIALVSDSIYPYNKGGKETRSYELAKNLTKKGHEVHFYTMKFWPGDKIIEKDGFFLHGIGKARPLYNGKRRSIKQGILFGFSAFKLFKEDFDVVDADHMVYFHLFPIKLACLIKNKPMIITWNEVWGKNYWIKYMGKKGIFGYWIEKLASKLPNKIISISEHTTNNLINKLNVKSEKIITIPCGININKIQSIKPSKESSDVIFAGRLLSHKNVDMLIKAISILRKPNPKIKCLIVGDGPEKDNLQGLTKKLKLEKNIIFKGFIEKHEDVLALIKSSMVFVLPSVREGFGLVAIEANACGIPVITINHKDNAVKDLIRDGENGYVCELDEKDISQKIVKAIKQGNSMKDACILASKKYDWSNMIDKFEGVYRG